MTQPRTFLELAEEWREEAQKIHDMADKEPLESCAEKLEALIGEWRVAMKLEGNAPESTRWLFDAFQKDILGAKR